MKTIKNSRRSTAGLGDCAANKMETKANNEGELAMKTFNGRHGNINSGTKGKSLLITGSLVALIVAMSSSQTLAVVITTTSGQTYTLTNSVSSTDLANQGQQSFLSLVQNSGSALFSSVLSELNNGDVYDGASPGDSTKDFMPSGGSVVTLTFNTSLFPKGFNVTQIMSLTGDGQDYGRKLQNYDVSYSIFSAPATFIPLASVVNQGSTGDYSFGGRIDEVRVLLDADGTQSLLTPIALNVAALQFTFHDVTTPGENAVSQYREFDVIGFEAPEPSSIALFALGGLALIRCRRSS